MKIELEIGNHYADLMSGDVIAQLSNICEIALQAMRRERVGSRTIAPTSRVAMPYQPSKDCCENPPVVSVGD